MTPGGNSPLFIFETTSLATFSALSTVLKPSFPGMPGMHGCRMNNRPFTSISYPHVLPVPGISLKVMLPVFLVSFVPWMDCCCPGVSCEGNPVRPQKARQMQTMGSKGSKVMMRFFICLILHDLHFLAVLALADMQQVQPFVQAGIHQ